MKTVPVVCGLLVLAVVAVYLQTVRHGFVNFDDDEYVYANQHVLEGISGKSIAWAFSNRTVSGQWQPIALLSLMVDVELSGVTRSWEASHGRSNASSPTGNSQERTLWAADSGTGPRPELSPLAARMHAVNVGLHAINVLLLFFLLRSMTRTTWRSALVAAIFAIHPLHVESVAWITERKDVLCGMFGLLTLAAYIWYARSPNLLRYLAVAAALALGLMCKPMLITWPLLLLLLDYWPLGRAGSRERGAGSTDSVTLVHGSLQRVQRTPGSKSGLGLVLEKTPLLLLAAASACVAFLAQRSAGAVVSVESAPVVARIARAAILYATYLGKTILPTNLAVHYPVQRIENHGLALAATVILIALTAGVLWGSSRNRPWLAVGWFWYLLTLTPTIGLVQVGTQVRADRFLYLPQIGLSIAAVWACTELVEARRERRWWMAGLAALTLAIWTIGAWRLSACWRNGETLWNRAVACTSRNAVAEYNLGVALRDNDKHSEAIPHFRKAVEFDAGLMVARNNLCVALNTCGRYAEAVVEYRKVLEIQPDLASAHYNFGNVLARMGQFDAAIGEYHKAMALEPDHAKLHHNLAVALEARNEHDAAIEEYRKALEIEPDDAECRGKLAQALAGRGRWDDALAECQKAIELATAENNQALVETFKARIGDWRKGRERR